MNLIVARNGDGRDGRIFQTEGTMTLFAIEMDVEIVVNAIVMRVAEFVTDTVAGVVEDVYEMRLAERL